MSSSPDITKQLLKYLLMEVKQERLDVAQAKEFIKAIGKPQQDRQEGQGDRNKQDRRNEPIAVVGIACRFPGAPDKERFWSNLLEGREHVGDFPAHREEDLRRVDTTSVLRKGGYLDRIDLFDAEYFGIPPQTATEIDPYHRNLMEVLVETAEDAGYSKSELYGTRAGIFVGNDHTHRLSTSYLPFLAESGFSAFTGSWSGILASRLSYHLNLRGPATVIDTGCSSGLVALDAAMKSLRQGDCDTAFVAAINLLLAPTSIGDGAESDDCRVRAFDTAANGTVWSEGVAGVFIKPLARALADGDQIYGVVLGSAVNNDGKSNGLTAPSARAQKELLVDAWKRAGIAPESLSYIEAHGTGTALGDPIEIKGLTSAFAEFTGKRQFCGLGSVKTNIGHTVGAAGLASLIKVMLCFDRELIPPTLHFDVPNELLDLTGSPVYVNDRTQPWKTAETPRRAGVSSFSLSGTNCHVVLEEPPARTDRPECAGVHLYPVSARNEELFAETVALQLAALDDRPGYRLDDICRTLQTGREHQPVRAVVLCDSREALREGLTRLLRSREEAAAHADGGPVVLRGAESAAGTDLPERFRPLAEAVTGYLTARPKPFAGLYRETDVRRVSLPPQLFDRARLWDESVRPRTAVDAAAPDEAEDENILGSPSRLTGEEDAPPARRVIAWIWSEVLGFPMISATDDFFALGGDSISSLKITQILNAEFGLEVPAATLLADRVFDDFADTVVRMYGLTDERVRSLLGDLPGPGPSNTSGPGPSGTSGPSGTEPAEEYELPLTAAQRSVYFASQRNEDSVAYNEGGLTIRREPLDVAGLETALRTLVARHDSLRSTFHLVDGEPVQRVHAQAPVSVEHRRLPAPAPGEDHETRARAEMKDFVRPFRIDTGPLFRVACFAFDDGVSCLAIDMHHIVTDGASMGVLFRELAAVSEGAVLPPLPKGYRTAFGELLDRQDRAGLVAHQEYWADRFPDEVPVLQLTTDRRRTDALTGAGATLFTTLDERTTAAAKRWAREHDITPYMLYLGVFQQLLSRLSGQRDLVIGAPVMGRPDLTYQDLIGMFVNTLPLRITTEPGTGVGAYFGGLKSTVLGAFAHQGYPLEYLIEEIDPPREPGRRPLFDVCFVHQNVDMGMGGERLVLFDNGSAKYDLTLSTRETADGTLLKWEYSTALFGPETIGLYAERYEELLRSVLASRDDESVEGLALIPARETELIRRNAQGPAAAPGTGSVVRLFERQAGTHPDRTALITGDARLTYGELNRRANRVAHGLIRQGVTPGSPVALLMDRSFDMVTAVLGVLKAGCHYVPLNTGFPAERLQVMLDDSGAGVLLATTARLPDAQRLASARLRVLDLQQCMESTRETADPALPSGADDPIYVMYTSGTTGVPKGALIRQRGVLRVAHRASFADAGPDDTFLLLSDYSFDGSVYDMYGALTNGASLVITDQETVLDVERLGATIERHGVTRFFITMSMFNTLVDMVPAALTGVRQIVCGGEAASPVHLRKAYDLLGPGRIANGYGPTETTVFAAVHVFDRLDDQDTVPIGRAITGTSLWVLDEELRPQPIGAVGELYIGGSGLADGYLNQPELTAERFVESPAVPGERLYRTGDLAAFKSNGLLYYHGRIDQQVKLRGYRIEPTEIADAALQEPYVRWAHAAVHETGTGGRSLCLWVRYAEGAGAEEDGSRLRAALVRRLPGYMVPSFIVATDEVRLNKNGKVDTSALPEPHAIPQAAAARPSGELQRRMADAWSHVLGIEVADIDANLFALGGDSIKAIQIVAKLKEYGITIRVMDLLEHQTIRALAQAASATAFIRSEAGTHDQGPLSGPVVPGPIQHAFLAVADHHKLRYNQSLLVTLDEPLSRDRLAHAAEQLVGYHDMLRVEIDVRGGLRLRDPGAPSLIHAETAPDGLSGDDLTRYLTELQSRVDLQGGPAVALAAGVGEEGRQFAVAIHHLAVDVVSWGILVEDLIACAADPEAGLPPKTLSFPAWTADLRRYTEEGGFRPQLPYWTGLARRTGGSGRLFEENEVARGETVAELIRLEETDGVRLLDAARESQGAGPAQTLVAVVGRALASVTGRDRILVTMEGHGREAVTGDHDVSRTVGWFTTTFPHLIEVERGVEDTVASVRRSFEELPDKGFGFGPLLRFDGAPEEDRAALEGLRPQISFNYLGGQDSGGEVAITHLPMDITTDEAHRSPYVLDITVHRTGNAVVFEVRYPETWRTGGAGPAITTAIRTAFHEVRDALTAGERRAFRTSSIRREVVDDILDDLFGEI
ncbi:amino acid adenylation domain-containing protein [Streptomyces sp. NPDC000594]|uniref:amino acid adenylation domain-containing protein n=1 Tax=Streptomyces sp. NPDC000594 TaxID=3154261 RepID=UPI0033254D68